MPRRGWHRAPIRLETGLLGPHLKGEWNRSQRRPFEIRGGQFHYKWPNTRYTNAPAYADLGTNIVSGGNRDGWFNIPTRNQVLGSFSYFKDGWGGSHNFKIGGEYFDERFDYKRGQDGLGYVPGDVMHILRNNNPSEVLFFLSPTASLNGLELGATSPTHGARIAIDMYSAQGSIVPRYCTSRRPAGRPSTPCRRRSRQITTSSPGICLRRGSA